MRSQVVARSMIAVLLAAVCVLAMSNRALAQAGASSDLLRVSLTTTSAAAPDILPPLEIPIPEGTPEGTVTAPIIPGVNLLYTELGPTGQPSDFLRINQYQVIIQSNLEAPLQRRTAVPAVAIPASAKEAFLPVSNFAGSDGNQPGTANTESDHVTIYTGFYGQLNPVPIFERSIIEPLPEGVTEGFIEFATGPLYFDLVEPDGSGVSDYVDLPNGITGFFLSSDNPSDFQSYIPTANAFVFEDPVTGVEVHYSVGFASDTEVPEPASCALLSLGALALAASGWRSRRAE
jgi:hypothetical protein